MFGVQLFSAMDMSKNDTRPKGPMTQGLKGQKIKAQKTEPSGVVGEG